MGSPRLLRFCRAHLRTGDAGLLRPRAALGERGSSRRVGLTSNAVRDALRAGADALLTCVLAPTCASCNLPLERPTDGAICAACWAAVLPLTPPLCDCCGDPLATWREPHDPSVWCTRCRESARMVTRARAIGVYEGPLRAIIHAFKYDGRRSLARPLAERMSVRGCALLENAEWLVPVPLHPARRRARGFNQAADLARHLGPPVCDALCRTRKTRTQAELPEAQRHQNVQDAFALTTEGRRTMAGARVVLVDDVSTTGATLEACARVLIEGGAQDVWALTAARVVSRPR